MQGGDYSMLVTKGISPAVWLLTLCALIAVWRGGNSVLDLWLMVVLTIWLFDIALAAVFGSSRFDLGFYAGRIYGLIAASIVLIALMVEMIRLYGHLTEALRLAEERNLDLINTRKMLKVMTAIARNNCTVIFTTHDPNAAAAIADQVVLLQNGSIIGQGEPDKTITSDLLSQTYQDRVEVIQTDRRPVVLAL